jgi:hypothetical protein
VACPVALLCSRTYNVEGPFVSSLPLTEEIARSGRPFFPSSAETEYENETAARRKKKRITADIILEIDAVPGPFIELLEAFISFYICWPPQLSVE